MCKVNLNSIRTTMHDDSMDEGKRLLHCNFPEPVRYITYVCSMLRIHAVLYFDLYYKVTHNYTEWSLQEALILEKTSYLKFLYNIAIKRWVNLRWQCTFISIYFTFCILSWTKENAVRLLSQKFKTTIKWLIRLILGNSIIYSQFVIKLLECLDVVNISTFYFIICLTISITIYIPYFI